MERAAAASLLPWLLAGALLSAQGAPDFSGEWVLESGPAGEPGVPESMSITQVPVATTVRGEPMPPFFKEVRITRIGAGTHWSETRQIGLVGGSVSGRVGGAASRRTHHRVVWEGQSLVFEQGSYTGSSPGTGVWTSRREVWSLDPVGRLRVAVVTRGSDDEPKTVVLVYRSAARQEQ